MAEKSSVRLNKVLRELNISLDRVVDHLSKKDIQYLSKKGHSIGLHSHSHTTSLENKNINFQKKKSSE